MRLRRALIISGFWLLQAAVIFLGWPVLFDPSILRAGASNWGDMIGDSQYIATSCAVILGLTAMQAAFVRPVHPPRLRRHDAEGSRFCTAGDYFLSNLASALALAFALAMSATVTMALVSGWDVLEFGTAVQQAEYTLFFGIFAGATIILTPLLMWRCRRATPVWLSLVIAGFAIAAMTTAAALALMSIVELIRGAELEDNTRRWVCGLPALLGWLVATPLLIAFARRRQHESFLSRLASLIFLGTLVETVAVLPIDFVIRKRGNCYCEQGTFWSLTLLGSLGLFALGPAIYLLPIGRRRRRWAQGRCEVCGYDMAATPKANRCPECGSGWRAPIASSTTTERSPGSS